MQTMNQSSQLGVGAKKKYTATLASGMTSALEQKDLEKALIKGKLRGKADIEIIARSAKQFEDEHEKQLIPAGQQFFSLTKRQQKTRDDKRKEISQEIFDYHLEHIKYSYYSKSALVLSTKTQTQSQAQTQAPIPATSSKPKILLHYHQADELELTKFITKFKIDLEKIGITQDQIMVMSELATELTASNISQFQQVISLVGSNFKSSLAKSPSNRTSMDQNDQKLEQQLELFDKQSVINLPVLALGEYTPELTRGFGGKSILILDLTQKYQDSIFNNNYQENFFSLAKTIYNITDLANSPKEVKEINDFFDQQRTSYYQKQKYLLDNKADLRIDRIIRENRYGLQTILEEIDEEIHQESRQAINCAKKPDYQKLSEILKEKNINIAEKETDGNTILHHLVKNPNDQEAQKLITKILDDYPDIDVNPKLDNQDSFIHLIAKNVTDIRDPELQKIIKRLVNKGSQSHHKNLENKSALEIFREKFTKFEIEDQIFNEITNPDLYIEVANPNPDIEKIKTLLADPENHQINCTNVQGENLLIRAVRDEEVELVEFLIKETQIDINHRDRNNLTALDYSENSEYKKTETFKKIHQLLKEITQTKTQINQKPKINEEEEEKSDFNSMSASIASAFDQPEDRPEKQPEGMQDAEASLTLLPKESTAEAKTSALTLEATSVTQNISASSILTPQNVIIFAQAIENLNEKYNENNKISKTFEQAQQQAQQSQQHTDHLPQSLIATANSNNDIKSPFIATVKNQIAIEDSKDIYDLTKIDIESILANLDNITIASSSAPATATAPTVALSSAPTSVTSSLDHNIFSEEEQQNIANCSSQQQKEQTVKSLLKNKKDQRANFLKEQSTLLLREFCFALAETLPQDAKDKSLFISYAWTQQEIVDFVRNHLEKDLHEAGFNVTLDTRDLHVGENIKEFEGKISQTDYIIMVADPSYKERSDNHKGGVGDEAKFLKKRLEAEIAKAQSQLQSQYLGSKQECFLNILLRSGNEATSIPKYVHRAINQTSAQTPTQTSAQTITQAITQTQKMIRTYDATRSQDDELTAKLQQEQDNLQQEQDPKKKEEIIKKQKDIIEKMRKTESIFENRYAQSLIDLLEEIYQHHLTKQQFENLKYGYYHSLNQLLEKTPIEIDALQQQEELNKQQRQRLIEQQLTPKQLIIEQLIAFIKDNQRTAEIIKIIRLQGQNINFNYQDDEGNSMLHYVAQTGNEKVFLEILKQQNINPHLKNKFNESPQDIAKKHDQTHLANLYKPDEIIFAVENNQIERLQILIDVFKNDVNQLTQDKEDPLTLLMLASSKGYKEVALILINAGANINQAATSRYKVAGRTPLHFACSMGHTETALALIEVGSNINQVATGKYNAGQTPLSFACKEGYTQTALALIKEGADINQATTGEDYAGQTPLSFACQYGHTETALALIKEGANVNQEATGQYCAGQTPLHFACKYGYTATALALIGAGADINQVARGSAEALIYEARADINQAKRNYYAGQTSLSFACANGHTQTALALIARGANINQATTGGNNAGMTPLHFACENGLSEIALALIQAGDDINKEATRGFETGRTPLSFACENGHTETALALIQVGADINQAAAGLHSDETPLHFACKKGHTQTALALIQAGADINHETTGEYSAGETPLHYACQEGLTEIALALIEAGADINHSATRGFTLGNTPLNFAYYYGHTETALALVQAGADTKKAQCSKGLCARYPSRGELYGNKKEKLTTTIASSDNKQETLLGQLLIKAAQKNNIIRVKALIIKGANVNQEATGKYHAGRTPLSFACENGNTEVALALIEAREKLDALLPQENLPDSTTSSSTNPSCASMFIKIFNVNKVSYNDHQGGYINYADKDGRTPLSFACGNGYTQTALALIERGANINQETTGSHNQEITESESSRTPLSFACEEGYTETALALIARGADINRASIGEYENGRTPLHFACENGHTETALALIREGADINQAETGKYDHVQTPLHIACEKGHTKTALALIEEGADINNKTTGSHSGRTPLSFACQNGHTKIVKALITRGADINQGETGEHENGQTPLHFACQRGHTEIAIALIEAGADINQETTREYHAGRTPLSLACQWGQTETALALIARGANINLAVTAKYFAGETPLHFACEKGHTEIALALIEAGADINQVATGEGNAGQTSLHFACRAGHAKTALALIEAKEKLDALLPQENLPDSTTTSSVNPSCASMFVKIFNVNKVNDNSHKGGYVNYADKDSMTPLSYACSRGLTEVAFALIARGSNINQVATGVNNSGGTPLSFACQNGHTEIALALIARGANVNQATTREYNAGRTPLSYACEKGLTEVALALIKEGADINKAGTGILGAGIKKASNRIQRKGLTPLSFACGNGHTQTALALIEAGADISKITKEQLDKLLAKKEQYGYGKKDDLQTTSINQNQATNLNQEIITTNPPEEIVYLTSESENQEIIISQEAITANPTEGMVYITSDLGFAGASDTFISVHNSTRTLLEEQTTASQIQTRSSITEFVSDEREDLTPNPSCSTRLARIARAKINDGCCNVM